MSTEIMIVNENQQMKIESGSPGGVTIRIDDFNVEKTSFFNLPRLQMIEALKHVIKHLEADLS
jgi:hypothetical protein